MARLRDAEGAEHELWAYSADGACVVQTRLADGTRSIAGHDCGAGPECADEAWVEFATIPPGSFSCDGARIGEGLRPGFVTMQARSSEPDEPVTISSRLGADVASWEIVPEDGPTVGPHEPLRHPGDPERAYLFATVERGWAGMDIITRDDAGDVIERQHFAR